MRVALPEKLVNVDVVPNYRSSGGQIVMKCDGRVEQAIHRQAFRDEINPQIARQKEIGLSRFDRNARRYPPAIEIPRARQHVMFRHDAPVRHGAGFAFDFEDSVNEHQRLIRQADTRRMRVNLRESFAKCLADAADSEFHALFASHKDGQNPTPGPSPNGEGS